MFRKSGYRFSEKDMRKRANLMRALLSLCLLLFAASAQAQVADFYRGKQIRIVVASGPGGGYDLYARYISRHLGKHVPGNPTVIVQNIDRKSVVEGKSVD